MSADGRPGLVVANGVMPSAEIVTSLLLYNPYILAADGGADKLLEIGILPDAVIGDFDSVSLDLPTSIERIYAADQNYTDLDKAISFLKEKGFKKVWIIAATGDRLDHTFGALSTLCKHGRDIDLILVDTVGSAKLVNRRYCFGTSIGTTISLLALGDVPSITTTGLKWNLVCERLRPGIRDGISNIAIHNEVTIVADIGDLIVYVHGR